MDVVKQRKKKGNKKIPIAAGLACLVIGYFALSGNQNSVARDSVLIDAVEMGELAVQVEGYGKLRSNKRKLITAQSKATVEEILLKPGAVVSADSVIMRLKNPELELEVSSKKRAYNGQVASLRKMKLTQLREKLSNQEKLELLKADYEAASVRQKAMEDLIEKGIVSRLDYDEIVMKAKQLRKRTEIVSKSEEQLNLAHAESLLIQEQLIASAKSDYEAVLKRFEQLTVKAGMDGVLQKLPVSLGQSLTAGQQIALVGATDDLIALVKIPQSDAGQVRIGQRASIDIRTDIIDAEVVRVSPTVEDGSVEVEINLTGNVPADARPEQSVDAMIFIEQIENAFFVQRPVNVRAHSTQTIYKLSDSQLTAQATPIEFGIVSGQYIQIQSGATAGDTLIISDVSYLDDLNEFKLVN